MTVVTAIEPTPTSPVSTAHAPASAACHRVLVGAWCRVEAAAASTCGLHHRVNEDAHSTLDTDAPVYVVADGVGGGAMAAQASRKLVSQLHRALEGRHVDAHSIVEAVLDADGEVGRSIARSTDASGAATLALCAGSGALRSHWLLAWVGDCRAYRVGVGAHGDAEQLTRDDTYRHLGEAPPPGGSLDDPARMVGNGAVSAPNIEHVRLRGDELLVLVSDGVHKHVSPQELCRVLRDDVPLASRCEALLAAARARGSADDATVLVVRRAPRIARLAAVALGAIVLLAAAALAMASWIR